MGGSLHCPFPFIQTHISHLFLFKSLYGTHEVSEYLTSYESLLIQTPLMETAILFSHMHNQSPERASPSLHQNSELQLRRKSQPVPSAPVPPPYHCASKPAHLTRCVFTSKKKLQDKLNAVSVYAVVWGFFVIGQCLFLPLFTTYLSDQRLPRYPFTSERNQRQKAVSSTLSLLISFLNLNKGLKEEEGELR